MKNRKRHAMRLNRIEHLYAERLDLMAELATDLGGRPDSKITEIQEQLTVMFQ